MIEIPELPIPVDRIAIAVAGHRGDHYGVVVIVIGNISTPAAGHVHLIDGRYTKSEADELACQINELARCARALLR